MNPQGPDNANLTNYRLGEMEKGLTTLRGDLKEAVGTLGGGLTALQTQLSSYQTNMSDKYVTRRDFDALRQNMDVLRQDMDDIKTRGWAVALALFVALSAMTLGAINLAARIGGN